MGNASRVRSPEGMAGAMASPTAPMMTASPMNCTEGVTPSAAHAAPIPDPTAAPIDHVPCIKGMRVRPAARSIADPSTLISTSRVPIPSPMTRKATLTSGTDRRAMATPMTAIAAAMTRSDAVTPPRLPSRWSIGAEATRPAMAPTVTPARSRPIVAMLMPSSALTAGSRGPQAATVIPPRPKAAMIALRHRNRAARSTTIVVSVMYERRWGCCSSASRSSPLSYGAVPPAGGTLITNKTGAS